MQIHTRREKHCKTFPAKKAASLHLKHGVKTEIIF